MNCGKCNVISLTLFEVFSIFGFKNVVISGFSVNRVVPTLQPVIPNPQMSPLAPVTSSARSTPLLLVEETGETQNTAAIEGMPASSNIIAVTNFQQPDVAMITTEEQQLVNFRVIKMNIINRRTYKIPNQIIILEIGICIF